jgi:hypothetical protein
MLKRLNADPLVALYREPLELPGEAHRLIAEFGVTLCWFVPISVRGTMDTMFPYVPRLNSGRVYGNVRTVLVPRWIMVHWRCELIEPALAANHWPEEHFLNKLLLLVLLSFNGNAYAVLDCYNDQGQNVSWTVGNVVPYLDMEPGVYVDCSANGNELLFIQQNFTGIRYAKSSMVEWTGDDATFIYQNLWIQYSASVPAGPAPDVPAHKR